MILLTALVLQQASASRVLLHPDDNERVSTPYGEVPTRTARAICSSQFAFIGVISSVSSRSRGNHVVSDLTFEVERTLYGAVPASPVLTTMGGTIDDHVVKGSSDLPSPKEGLRYMLSYSLLKRTVGISQEGDPIITATFWISPPDVVPASELPSEQELVAQLNQFCEEHSFPRYHDVMGG